MSDAHPIALATPENRPSPWHPGERTLQATVGVAERMDVVGRKVVRDHLTQQHRDFYPLLPFIVTGSVDRSGDAWATLLMARPGFLSAPDPWTLSVTAPRDPSDPADVGTDDGAPIGLLGIELLTRRRNRVNGRVRRQDDRRFEVAVEESFGNCPKYIQAREPIFASGDPAAARPVETLDRLDDAARNTIRHADTFFVASYVDREGGRRQVDVSHRGGRPGFVRIGDDGWLTIPDFSGNLFFSTLGNILLNNRAGLVFVNFAAGDLLHLTGDAEVILQSPDIAAFTGAQRLWRFKPRGIVRRMGVLPLRWQLPLSGWSPDTLATGAWQPVTHQDQ